MVAMLSLRRALHLTVLAGFLLASAGCGAPHPTSAAPAVPARIGEPIPLGHLTVAVNDIRRQDGFEVVTYNLTNTYSYHDPQVFDQKEQSIFVDRQEYPAVSTSAVPESTGALLNVPHGVNVPTKVAFAVPEGQTVTALDVRDDQGSWLVNVHQ
jgi:hypothetical protein